jgi:hypothetical protein
LTKLKVPAGVGDTGTIDFRDRRIVISWSAGAIPEGPLLDRVPLERGIS